MTSILFSLLLILENNKQTFYFPGNSSLNDWFYRLRQKRWLCPKFFQLLLTARQPEQKHNGDIKYQKLYEEGPVMLQF